MERSGGLERSGKEGRRVEERRADRREERGGDREREREGRRRETREKRERRQQRTGVESADWGGVARSEYEWRGKRRSGQERRA